MTLTAEEIDRVVQEVIRRITSAGVEIRKPCRQNATLELDDRLVTLATIEGRLDGVQQLSVLSKAVVTPSVRDELRDKNVQLVRTEQQGK